MHLMATNVAVWARTVIEEIWEDFILKYIKASQEGGYSDTGGKYGKILDPYTANEQENWVYDLGPGAPGVLSSHIHQTSLTLWSKLRVVQLGLEWHIQPSIRVVRYISHA